MFICRFIYFSCFFFSFFLRSLLYIFLPGADRRHRSARNRTWICPLFPDRGSICFFTFHSSVCCGITLPFPVGRSFFHFIIPSVLIQADFKPVSAVIITNAGFRKCPLILPPEIPDHSISFLASTSTITE